MSTSFSTSHDVAAGVEAAYAALAGARWPAAVAERLHDDSRVESLTPTPDGGAVLVHSRKLPDGAPGFLQAFLPKDGRVTQTDTWGPAEGDARRGTWRVSFPGAPAEVAGTTSVLPAGDGSTWTIAGTATVRLPLVGGKAERYIADLVVKLVDRQVVVLRDLV